MKIYFAGSIRGGREHTKWYVDIAELLQGYGDILTLHVTDKSLSDKGESLPVEQIFNRDMQWIKECDVLVADVTIPSLGVGYEIARAEILNKPIVCLFHENIDKSLSGIIQGNKRITVKRYKTVEDITQIIKEFFENINK